MSLRKLLIISIFAFSANAQALTLEYVTPDGSADTTDVIEVWVRITADTAFSFDEQDPDGDMSYGGAIDPSEVPTGGFSPDANMGMGGFVEFDFIDFAGSSVSLSCGGSFTQDNDGNCDLDNENYSFSFGTMFDWAPSGSLVLAPGDSIDILLGTFTPVAGGATPGVYNLFNVGIGISFSGVGFDDFGEEQFANAFFSLGSTCPDFSETCDFTRVVGAQVPVPAAFWLMISGMLGLFGVSKRST